MDEIGWLSITDYAFKTGISISTIRRKIKNNQIEFKAISGKYLIRTDDQEREYSSVIKTAQDTNDGLCLKQALEIERLKIEIKKLQSEVIEQKMLIDLLEQGLGVPSLPSLPR